MSYKEIVTKAVLAKGKKKYKNDYEITTDIVPSTILGCWIINHNFNAKEENNKIVITGSYDVNIWYSYDSDTKTNVITKTLNYQFEEQLKVNNPNIIGKDIIVKSLHQPTCLSAKEENNTIKLEIELELGIELIGDTKVKISSIDEEETWEDLNTNNELDSLEENYLKENLKEN